MKLTIHDLLKGQERSECGLGLYGHEARTAFGWRHTRAPHVFAKVLDEQIVEIANVLRWTADDLHLFMDSRYGRHTGDELGRFDNTDSQPTQVAQFLERRMREAIARLREDVAK